MFGIGIPELIVIIILLLSLFIQLYLPIFLKKRYPLKMWLGILLSIILFPFGHLYIDRAAIYIIALIIVAALSQALTGELGFSVIVSPIIMYFRISKEIKKSRPNIPINDNNT